MKENSLSTVSTTAAAPQPTYRGWNLLCFAVLGFLAGRSAHQSGWPLAIWVGAGWLFGLVALGVLSIPLRLLYYDLVMARGSRAIPSGISQGFLSLIPFTVLAVMADVFLGWNATAAFTSAGLMFCGGATVTAFSKLNPQAKKSLVASVVPSLAAAGLAFAWMIGVALLHRALGASR